MVRSKGGWGVDGLRLGDVGFGGIEKRGSFISRYESNKSENKG